MNESVLVQWLDCAAQDEMTYDEIVSTGIFANELLRRHRGAERYE
jgi:hypothetical protein